MGLHEQGITVVALSKDPPDRAAFQASRDSLQHVQLWSDADLSVIRQLGALHRGAIEFATWPILGVPLGVPTGFEAMAVPTTFLVDEDRILRWIDQDADYRQRGDEARVRAAIEQAFG